MAHYSGFSIDVGGTPTPVTVFIETPQNEETPERTFPSVAIRLLSINPEFDNIREDADEIDEEVGYDPGPAVHERIMRESPLPWRLLYSIDTWHRVRAIESRDLVSKILVRQTRPRSYITAQNIDGEDITLWTFMSGGIVSNDEERPDEVIYHKTATVEVLAYLSLVDFDDVTREKVAMELNWTVFSRELVPGPDGKTMEEVGDPTKHLSLRITDTGAEPIE